MVWVRLRVLVWIFCVFGLVLSLENYQSRIYNHESRISRSDEYKDYIKLKDRISRNVEDGISRNYDIRNSGKKIRISRNDDAPFSRNNGVQVSINEPRDSSNLEEESSYEKALNSLKEIFSREVPESDIDDSQRRDPGISGQNINEISKNSRKYDNKFSKRTLHTMSEVPQQPNKYQMKRYLNEWVIHMSGGEETARMVVKELGYKFHGSVKGFEDVYTVSHLNQHHNHKRETEEITRHINSHVEVLWAEQQVSRPRDKRSIITEGRDTKSYKKLDIQDKSAQKLNKYKMPIILSKSFMKLRDLNTTDNGSVANNNSLAFIRHLRSEENMFNDPLWKHQWYLFDSRTHEDLPRLDLKVIPVWKSGITGKGVKITVIDDGLEWNHTDLIKNYNADISYDLNDDDVDPTPRYDDVRTNSHGTKCAGEIAMMPNNEKCGVGVAYGASIGGIRMLDGEVSDRMEGAALAIGLNMTDIVSCSWGPTDDGMRVEGPGRLAEMALEKGVKEGRKGKGIIFVWAAGNGGSVRDNCNCDGYVSSIYTISVSTASENGESPWYSEHCASTLTSAYSSGAYSDQKISTTDIENDCTISFSGTSASAPLAAAIIALALEANPNMTWRDIQHAVVKSSDWSPLSRDNGWQINGAGLHFNVKFGFGLLRAEPLVNASRGWKPVPEKQICRTDAYAGSEIVIESGGKYAIEITPICNSFNEIKYLEHVQIILSLTHSNRGSLKMSLTSPKGTKTSLLTPRPSDNSDEGFFEWPFTSVHTWGEDPEGKWKLGIEDTSNSGQNGTIISVSLILHGTAEPVQ